MAEYLIDKAYLTALGSILRKKLDIPYQVDFNRIISDLNNLNTETFNVSSSSMTINRTGDLYTIQDETLSNLANAIRSKSNRTSKMTPQEMVDAANQLKVIYQTIYADTLNPHQQYHKTVYLDNDVNICCEQILMQPNIQGVGFDVNIYDINNSLVMSKRINFCRGIIDLETKLTAGTYSIVPYLNSDGYPAGISIMGYR